MIKVVVKVTTEHIQSCYGSDDCALIPALQQDTGSQYWNVTVITRATTEEAKGMHLISGDINEGTSKLVLYKCDEPLAQWYRVWRVHKFKDVVINQIPFELDMLNKTAKLVATGAAEVENYDRGGFGHGK